MGFYVVGSKRNKFRVIEERFDGAEGRTQKTVPREAYSSLGFSPAMTLEEARLRAKQINAQEQLEARKRAGAARRIALAKAINTAYLPEQMNLLFEQRLTEQYADNPSRLDNVLKQWNVVKRILSDLALDPKDFHEERQKFYLYFKQRERPWSPAYVKKLVRLINLWGHFVSYKRDSSFQPLPKLSNIQVERLNDSRENVVGIKRVCEPLTWKALEASKHRFEQEGLLEKWNWIYIALWFGLRPIEVDGLKSETTWRVERDVTSGIDVLSVYQSKLTSVSKDRRWKVIPVYFEEQKVALKLIKQGAFSRPLNKTIKRLIGDRIETYSPRKGFTDLMLERGFKLEDVSTFLGHASIDMTWRHYKSKKKFNLPA
jgi:integrase